MNGPAAPLLRCLRVSSVKTPISRQWRSIASSPVLYSGHNKWSKIRHDKGVADQKKNIMRAQTAKVLTMATRVYGKESPQLATTLATARKAGVPKAIIDAAIERGLGRAVGGAALESMTFEALMPPSVAVIIDVETDNKARTLQDINASIKKHRGTVTSTKFFFSRRGRVVFEAKDSVDLDEVLDAAIEAGAEDLDSDEDGSIVVWTEPSLTTQVARDLGAQFGLQTLSSDIVWSPNEDTMSSAGSPDEVDRLGRLLVALREFPEVQAVYSNVSRGDLSEEAWAQVEENLDT